MEGHPSNKESVRERIPMGMVSDELWRMLLDRTQLPMRIEHQLRGDRLDFKSQTWTASDTPRINDEGINWLMSIISPYCEVAVTTTEITKDEVNRFTKEIMNAIIGKFEQCWKDFGIKDSDLIPLVRSIEQIIFLNLSASREGLIIKQLMPHYTRDETYRPIEEKKQGFWSGLNILGFGGKKE